jgi:spermidine/putrescine transport system ATP-binding protein
VQAELGGEIDGPSPNDPIDVRIDSVWKVFQDETIAVRDLSLDIRKGEFFSLLGPSGCGKTTTLRMIAGFEEPTAGTIELQGVPIQGVPPYRRNVNTVFQSYALFPHLNVYENVAYGLRRKKVPKGEVASRVDEILELVQLSGLGNRRPDQLSGGQQQRVALARALVNYPAVLLLDEPLGALDLKLRKAMQIELKRIQREVGITFIYVTHDQEEALTMSDRLAVMNAGQMEQVGAPWDIYERPATSFVAGFIGTSNVMHGAVATVRDGWATLSGKDMTEVRVPAEGLDLGAEIDFTVRPEKIELFPVQDAPDDGRCRVRGKVTDLVYQGVSTQYLIETASGSTLVVFVQNRRDAEDVAEEGDEVLCLWQPQHNVVLVDRDKAVAEALAAATTDGDAPTTERVR